jgi:NAD(P)-dependent dehydrogenase (short-subunit alcohol dehydrogenase family)
MMGSWTDRKQNLEFFSPVDSSASERFLCVEKFRSFYFRRSPIYHWQANSGEHDSRYSFPHRSEARTLAKNSEQMTTKENSMAKLEGKIALITGGNSGIGLATAKRFVDEGAYVFITGRRDPELAAAVKDIGKNVTGVQGDVSNIGDLDRLFAQISREKGKLDIVFANAGVAKFAPFGTITEEFYDSIFNINVKGLLFTVQKALPLLSDGASVILNASIVASKGFSSNSVYSATKAAVRSFARTWTTDLKDRRIRVNAVSPGSTDTPGLSELLASSETGQQRLKMVSSTVPLGRLGTPDEIAKAVVFLASDDSSYITGTELFVDGGVAQV